MSPEQKLLGSYQAADVPEALALCKRSFLTAAFFSLFINVLVLVPMIYTMQVYDRVISTNSESTLLMLTLMVTFIFFFTGALEWIRSQILIVTSARIEQALNARVFDAMFAETLASGGKSSSTLALSDLLQLRQFLTGNGFFAFLDAPWLPIYLVVMFWFHVTIGLVGLASALILMGLNICNELSTREILAQANHKSTEASQQTQRNLRNIEVIESMGMLARLRARWQEKQGVVLALQAKSSDNTSLISALSKVYRQLIQALIIGLGAYLVIHKELSAGSMFAASVLLGRALAPLDMLVGSWRGFLGARESYARLQKLLTSVPKRTPPMPLPAPVGEIRLENVAVIPPGGKVSVIAGINLLIEAGEQIALIGPSAAGKSTLARTMLGLYRPITGSVRLDGAEVGHWDREALGQYIGYLPQDVELLDGSISENIARFGEIDSEQIVSAAQTAGIHDMILRLPEGYDTLIQGHGNLLSAGQRQRLGLARALYGDARVIVLDEPNSNLDQDGEAALSQALFKLRQRACTLIIITHRAQILNQVDKIAVMKEGKLVMYGPKNQVIAALQPQPATALPQAG